MNNFIKINNINKKYEKNKTIKVLNNISFNYSKIIKSAKPYVCGITTNVLIAHTVNGNIFISKQMNKTISK